MQGIMKINVDERQALCHPLLFPGELAVDPELYYCPASLRATRGSLEEALDTAGGGGAKTREVGPWKIRASARSCFYRQMRMGRRPLQVLQQYQCILCPWTIRSFKPPGHLAYPGISWHVAQELLAQIAWL